MKFEVLRQHYGDKQYQAGDEREADERDVAHLVKSGVLKRKAEPKTQNKAEKAAPKNKSA
ncbi:hypothetical protein [Georhizobium sp. MAB10]|uniref:hypothetical protein n=1 Tax=Georhizobium sp. MAB10 TaxID=3028319 RepID=UPI0038560249